MIRSLPTAGRFVLLGNRDCDRALVCGYPRITEKGHLRSAIRLQTFGLPSRQ
jgi:hypothetical protein